MRKRYSLLFVLVLLVLGLAFVYATGAQSGPESTPAPTSESDNPRLTMVPMPDGVRLATDVYLPPGHGPWPTILMRTPYSRGGMAKVARLFNGSGYGVVVQDTRGRFGSEGTDDPFFSAAQDGQASLAWIATQTWNDGRIGTWGPSALGINQYLMAPDAPEALRCQFVMVAAPDLYRHAAFQGGAWRQSLVEGWLRSQGSQSLIDKWTDHRLEDSFWDPTDISGRYGEIRVPTLHLGGWYDIFTQGTLDAFVGYQEGGGPGAAGNQHLLLGPWTHTGMSQQRQGELTYPENGVWGWTEQLQLAVDWFDWCLAGEQNEVTSWPTVRYYVMGDVDDPEAPGNVWRDAETWPPPAVEQPLYLRSDARLSQPPPEADEPGDSFVYDPNDPSPTVCGANLLIKAGPCDQRPVEARDDALVYSTPPLEEPLEVTGRVRARIWLVSDAPDTDVTARLTDVYPDGRSMLVTDGVLRARFRGQDLTREELMTPGTPYELEIDLGSTSIVFNAGHRIRLIVSSSNAPRFAPNPNTGAPLRADDGTRIATNTILHDAAHPSALLLPVPQE